MIPSSPSQRLKRREVLGLGATGAAAMALYPVTATGATPMPHQPNRPNVLLIICDHLSPRVMGCYGAPDSATPNIDALAEAGVCFDRAYTTVPLCQPARASFLTGLYPHQSGVRSNGNPARFPHRHLYLDAPVGQDVPTLGSLFADAGYTAMHFGKTHDRGGLRGFTCAAQDEVPVEGDPRFPLNHDTFRDRHTTQSCEAFLRNHAGGPFIAVADLNNPHNICGWVGAHAGHPEDLDPDAEGLPDLPPNFTVDDFDSRPDPVRYLCCSHNRQAQAAQWDETAYRYYLQAYRYYCGLADAEVGRLLAALRQRPDHDNTVVVVMADHGDGLASHRMVTKQVAFYEQLVRVPLIVAGSGVVPHVPVSEGPLVSLLDLLPTCCDIAGIETPLDKPGRSLKPWLRGQPAPTWRKYVVSEWLTEWGHTINPGRMLRDDRFKYVVYRGGRKGEQQEELYDLHADPWETRTLHNDPEHTQTLERLRQQLSEHLRIQEDHFQAEPVFVRADARQHAPGYGNHRGLAAPALAGQGINHLTP